MTNKRSESLAELTLDFLACRDKGHHWAPLNAQVTAGTKNYIREVTRTYQCKNCLSEQFEKLELPSMDSKRSYKYTDGYLLAKGAVPDGKTRVPVADVRKETLGRILGIEF